MLGHNAVVCGSMQCQLTPRYRHISVDSCRIIYRGTGAAEVGVGLVNAEPHTSARPDSTPRSRHIRPRRGPLLPPSLHSSSLLATAPCCLSLPSAPQQTLTPKCSSRRPDLACQCFPEVMLLPLFQSISLGLLALSLKLWKRGGMLLWYFCRCICVMYDLV